jgi:hypothetical protein
MISDVRLAAIILVVWTAAQASERPCAEVVGRIAALNGAPQRKALRVLLSGDFLRDHESLGCLFHYGDRLRQPLHDLLRDPKFRERAVVVLFLIDDPSVRSLFLIRPPSYSVLCMMLEPASEEEWALLRKAASNGFNDRWIDYGAIQTLKLIASPRSRQILEEVGQLNPDRAEQVAAALAYVRSSPPPLSDADLDVVAKRTAEAVKIGKLEAVGPPQYNQARDKALVDFLFKTGSDDLIYTATFRKTADVWRLRGVQETMQAMRPPPIILPLRPTLLLPPPPDLPFDPPAIPPLFPLLQPKMLNIEPPLFHRRG